MTTTGEQQPAPPRARARPRRPAGPVPLAQVDPVATVVVAVPLAHLDRPFEYAVPQEFSEIAQPGVRVKVRFAGRDVDGFIVARRSQAEHTGRLTAIRRVVSPEPVLSAALLAVVRRVAQRYAGTTAEVLRLAIPPRHARAEAAVGKSAGGPSNGGEPPAAPTDESQLELGPWLDYPAGPSFLRRLGQGENPWAAWSAAPTTQPARDWPRALALAAQTSFAAGRGALIVVPDARDVARVEVELAALLGTANFVRLTADQGPQARYSAWLKIRRGQVHVVVGTRAAAFAPVANLGLVAWWDDGDDLFAEPRAPYPHVREILRIQAEQQRAALLVGGYARSVAITQWLKEGRLRELGPADQVRRLARPHIEVAGEAEHADRDGPAATARLPSAAWRALHHGLTSGPVLIQVPRAGYLPALSCETCRAPIRCPVCHGPVGIDTGGADGACRWCARVSPRWQCEYCGGRSVRSRVVGSRRTAEELGRAFPGVPVQTSGGQNVLAQVPADPALVVATPGAEPIAVGGYSATVLLDAWASLDRPTLDAGQEALRRWLLAAALTRPRDQGGRVVLCGVPGEVSVPAVEALVRWAPEWFAERDLADRAALALPPTVWMAVLTGPASALRSIVAQLDLPGDVFGPQPLRPVFTAAPATTPTEHPPHYVVLRGPLERAGELTAAMAALRAQRSARREQLAVSVRIDGDDALA